MTGSSADDRLARAVLSYVADPGDQALGALLRYCRPAELVAALAAGRHPLAGRPGATATSAETASPLDRSADQLEPVGLWDADELRTASRLGRGSPPGRVGRPGRAGRARGGIPGLDRALRRWGARIGQAPTAARLADWGQDGLRLICPGDPEWPTQLAALRGALAADGVTVAVLASGLSYGYPKGHAQLFEAIAAQGVLVSEMSPDRRPTRPGFLVRNRLIAALSRGTVVVEAALRSGALSTAARARDLVRPLMAVPGPVTSGMSAGCHELIREWGAVLVTGARDVLEHVSPIGEELAGPRRGPALPLDDLDPVTRAVLEAVPLRGGSGPATIAVSAGVDLDTTIGCLGSLAAGGFVERSD